MFKMPVKTRVYTIPIALYGSPSLTSGPYPRDNREDEDVEKNVVKNMSTFLVQLGQRLGQVMDCHE